MSNVIKPVISSIPPTFGYADSAASQWSQLIPQRTDRALLVGQTGSGKTTLARYLLNHRQYKAVLDYKGRIEWPEYRLCKTIKELTRAKEPALLYRPSYFDSQDEETCNKLWEWLYTRG
jgi:ATPase subunit of ABC transporter with duplicated ATPase domains